MDLHDFDDVAENYDLYLEEMYRSEDNHAGCLDFYLEFAREYGKIEYTDISDEELDQFAAGRLRMAVVEGDEKEGCFLAGQSAGMVTKEQTCAEIIADLMQDADRVLGELRKWEK